MLKTGDTHSASSSGSSFTSAEGLESGTGSGSGSGTGTGSGTGSILDSEKRRTPSACRFYGLDEFKYVLLLLFVYFILFPGVFYDLLLFTVVGIVFSVKSL